jgi:hypothetical protein
MFGVVDSARLLEGLFSILVGDLVNGNSTTDTETVQGAPTATPGETTDTVDMPSLLR